MQLSTSLNVFGTEDPTRQAIERCKRAGFSVLDFNYWDHQEDVLQMSRDAEEAWAWRIRRTADAADVRLTQMHGPVHGRAFQHMVLGLNVDSFLELAKRSIQTAGILGIPWVVFHPSRITVDGDDPYQEVLQYNHDFFQRLLPTLEGNDVGIALENMIGDAQNPQKRFCATPEQLVELIDRLDHPLVGACWDTGHGHITGLDQAESIKTLGHRLKATHVQDNDGRKDQHLLPYHGTVEWDAVLRALRDISFAGDFTYEVAPAIGKVPGEIRDAALRYAVTIGTYLLKKNV